MDREGRLQEARRGRLYPGDGGLPLAAYLEALPVDREIELELPVARSSQLSPVEKAKLARVRVSAYLDALPLRHME